ncbi:putative dihydrofolate reductase [Bacillus phage pW2]|uniref:dihydrofolate reductase n=1 Tax=Bacillus phage pW2 TaxID=2500559 RepID=A0A3T0IHL0_9CAUD|nr:dihydrofolate reductase [Bacillus phage pW2]AZU98900.1 putative dihydrofolate reductase [Bacillus phage pW2]
MISIIACVDMGMGIGDENNSLLFDLPSDRKYFRQKTKKKIVVMGRKTWESLPKRPLDQRENYVLTRDKDYVAEGATVIHSIDDIVELGKGKTEVFVMGGGELYKEMMPLADKLYMTHVHTVNFDARVFFPDFGIEWKQTSSIKHKANKKHKYSFTFAEYVRAEDEETK